MAQPVEPDVPPHPPHVRLLGPRTVVVHPEHKAQLLEQLGLRTRAGIAAQDRTHQGIRGERNNAGQAPAPTVKHEAKRRRVEQSVQHETGEKNRAGG
jgi:hypothetical protein